MTGIYVKPVTAKAVLACDRCGTRWNSPIYVPHRWRDEVEACAPAFAIGWRIYNGARSQRTYCPSCGPVSKMRLLYGTERPQA